MKSKLSIILIMICTALTLSSCGNSSNTAAKPDEPEVSEQEQDSEDNSQVDEDADETQEETSSPADTEASEDESVLFEGGGALYETTLEEVLKNVNLDTLDHLPYTISMSGGPEGCLMKITLDTASENSVDVWKAYSSSYTELGLEHKAALFKSEDTVHSVMLVCDLNEE